MPNYKDQHPNQKTMMTEPLMTTHYSNIDFTAVQKQVQRYVNELSKDEGLKEIFDNNKVILSKCQPLNNLRHLTNAKFSNEANIIENGVHKCKRKNCKICEMYLQEDKEFELSSGKIWKVKNVVTCKAKNVIY